MPMYYFHLRDDDVVSDIDGTELAGPAAARAHAEFVAHELMFKRDGMLQRGWSRWTMSVWDSAGNEVLSFPLSDLQSGGFGR